MVFLTSEPPRSDTEAIQVKLDELIRADGRSHNVFSILEKLRREDALKPSPEVQLASAAREPSSGME